MVGYIHTLKLNIILKQVSTHFTRNLPNEISMQSQTKLRYAYGNFNEYFIHGC